MAADESLKLELAVLRRTTALNAPSPCKTTRRNNASPATRSCPRDPAAQLGAGAAAAGVVARRRRLRGLQIRWRSTDPRRTRWRCLASVITTVQMETRTSPGICASSPRNEISRELTSLVWPCGFWDMWGDRQTYGWAHYNALHPYWRQSNEMVYTYEMQRWVIGSYILQVPQKLTWKLVLKWCMCAHLCFLANVAIMFVNGDYMVQVASSSPNSAASLVAQNGLVFIV